MYDTMGNITKSDTTTHAHGGEKDSENVLKIYVLAKQTS